MSPAPDVMRAEVKTNQSAARWTLLASLAALPLACLLPLSGFCATNTYLFTYTNRTALLADGWSFIATTNAVVQSIGSAAFNGGPRNTENTNTATGGIVAYAQTNSALGIVSRIHCDIGSTWGSPVVWTNGTFPSLSPIPKANQTRNSFFRSLPTNWVSARLSISLTPTQNFQQVILMLYQDDDHYVETAFSYNSFLMNFPFSFPGPTAVTLDREFHSFPSQVVAAYVAPTNLSLRMDRESGTDDIKAYYSPNGTNWTFVGQTSQQLTNTRLGIVIGGSPTNFPLTNLAKCDVRRVDIITSATYSPPPFKLVLQPKHLVFNSIETQPCIVTQRVNVVIRNGLNPVNWTVSSNAAWLSTKVSAGQTPGFCDVYVNTAGLTAGVYEGALTFAATGPVNSPAQVPVTLIVNPDGAVRLSTWKDAKAGAMTVWVDDSQESGFTDLQSNGLTGTYALWHLGAPLGYSNYYSSGMELGSHTVDHPCFLISEPALRFQIESNVLSFVNALHIPQSEVISLAWPCGVTSIEEQTVAADYFLISRGYNINQLEEPTPNNFMNVKSFNSHEHFPYPPADFKTLVDAAIAQGKWFILVLHGINNHDGAISYALDKDIWFATGGAVTKYILLRDRTVLTNYTESSDAIRFDCYRLPLDSSTVRSFETAVSTNDEVTFTVNVGTTQVFNVLVDGVPAPYTQNGNVACFNLFVTASPQSVVVNLAPNPPLLPAQSNRNINALTTLVVTNTATVSTNPPGGSTLTTNTFLCNYQSMDWLFADEWSFTGSNTNGTSRDTQITDTNIGVVAYARTNAAIGTVLRVPCGPGDLWQTANNTRNSLFRALPPDWLSLRLAMSIAPAQNFQQAHLALYQNDDNYVEIGRMFDASGGGQLLRFTREFNQSGLVLNSTALAATNLSLRLDRNPGNGNIAGLYSSDGTNWSSMGQVSQTFTNTRLAIWVGGATNAYTNTLLGCDLSRVEVVRTNPFFAVTYSLTVTNSFDASVVSNATIDPNGIITWTPTEGQASGVYVFTTIASYAGSSATNDFSVNVWPSDSFQILSLSLTNNSATIIWSSAIGQTYRMQYKNLLGDDEWTDVVPDLVATGLTTSATNNITGSTQRFYRIFVVPPPS